jgi:hypothetical protein
MMKHTADLANTAGPTGAHLQQVLHTNRPSIAGGAGARGNHPEAQG